jgi:hypothetical protein
MNEPHENLDHDPFSDDGIPRRSRLRRDGAVARRRARTPHRAAVVTRPSVVRIGRRPCPCAPRGVGTI